MKLTKIVTLVYLACASSWSADTSVKTQLKDIVSKHTVSDKNETKKEVTPTIKGVAKEDLPPSPP